MCVPSGDHDGEPYEPSGGVMHSGSPPSGSTRKSAETTSVSQRSPRSAEKTILFPSGDQAGAPSSQSPSVICFAGSDPSAETTKRCLRRSGVPPAVLGLLRRLLI